MPTNKPPPPFSASSIRPPRQQRWAPVLEPLQTWLDSWRGPLVNREAGSAALVGVDEAGRGPLAGPVCAAAVCLPAADEISGLADSKRLSARQRTSLAERIRTEAHAWALGWASAAEIDALNVLKATHLAMSRAVAALAMPSAVVLVDGNRTPPQLGPCLQVGSVIKGDGRIGEISAASILAKTARDAHMEELDRRFPGYGFAEHKGYPTALHLERLRSLGPCVEHRRSFGPVRELPEQAELVL